MLINTTSRHLYLVISLLWASLAVLAVYGQYKSIDQAVRSGALHNAVLLSRSLSEFRSLYTREVVSKAAEHGINISHDYHNKANTIPLPASATILIGDNISSDELGITTSLYSPYPFPWRENNFSGSFKEEAWKAFQQNQKVPYYRFTTSSEGSYKLQFATADVLSPSCVDCHNNHSDSPKRDWRAGDVRGILQIDLNLGALQAEARQNTLPLLFTTGFGLFIALVLLAWTIAALRQKSGELELEVQAQTEKLQHNIKLLEKEAQGHQQTLKTLEESKHEAQQANTAKSQFLMKMSHEFRTPLNAIIGFSTRLINKRNDALSERETSALESIQSSGKSLLEIVNNLIDISRIEIDNITLSPQAVALEELCQTLVKDLSVVADESGNQLTLEEPQQPATLFADPNIIRQILLNLVGNAIKHTENGSISIGIALQSRENKRGHVITVTDTGPGIPQEQIKKLFEPFYQIKQENNLTAGTGLGLSIAKELAALLGGHVDASSTLGEGSCFRLWLPLGADDIESK